MAIPKRDEYLSALRNLRPNVYKFGELIPDVTTHPATRRTVESHALSYDAANDPELADLYTTTSTLTREKIARWNSLMWSADDLIGNMRMKRQNYRRCGLRRLERAERDVGGHSRHGPGARHRLSGEAQGVDPLGGAEGNHRRRGTDRRQGGSQPQAVAAAGSGHDPADHGGAGRRDRAARRQGDDLRHRRLAGDLPAARRHLRRGGPGLRAGLRRPERHRGPDHRRGDPPQHCSRSPGPSRRPPT